jgi:hypothetical protein
MITDRRAYRPASGQPVLRRTANRRHSTLALTPEREAEVRRGFDLERFAADWRRGVGTRRAAADAT